MMFSLTPPFCSLSRSAADSVYTLPSRFNVLITSASDMPPLTSAMTVSTPDEGTGLTAAGGTGLGGGVCAAAVTASITAITDASTLRGFPLVVSDEDPRSNAAGSIRLIPAPPQAATI